MELNVNDHKCDICKGTGQTPQGDRCPKCNR